MSTDRRLLLELLGEGSTQAEMPRSGVLTIGSAIDKVGFHVQGQGVADVHCAIGRAKGGGFALKDLGSEYGTWVNGERVQQAKLEAGDVILVGSRRLRVVDPAAPAQAPVTSTGTSTGTPPATTAAAATAARPEPAPLAAPSVASRAAESGGTQKPQVGATNYESSPLPRIPGYRIEKLLGRGGMGEVFLATQERLDRKVALKLLSAKLCADADFVRRFQDEARAAAALSHPNVVVVHDVGVEGGRHFLSMEFMDHGNLEAQVARGARMGWQQVLAVLHDIASALVYAEGRGIVHRDIKPANLMQGAAGATKLADLGLATQIEAEASDSESGRIFGTPHFISPEQARGERVDGRSDLYSLGATAYRLLSGRTPFEGATTRDILRGHFTEKPPSLSSIDATIPAEVVRIVERLLEKKPDDRFPSAAVLLQDVDRVRAALIHGESAGARRGGGGAKAAALGALVLIGGIAAWKFLGDGGTPEAPPTPPGPQAPVNPPGPGNGADPAQGGVATSPVEGQGSPPPPNPGGGDNETRMKLFEAEAKLAWKDLPVDLVGAERAARLEQLAKDYAGTGAAADMQAEADLLRADLAREHAATAAVAARRGAALQVLEAAIQPFPEDPARAMDALSAQAIEAELQADPEFQKVRLEVYERVLARGLEAASAESRIIDEAAARGDFDEVSRRIDALVPRLRLPKLPEGLEASRLPTHAVIESLARELSARSEGLAAERADHAVRIVDADRERIAGSLGLNREFEKELRTLDFAALHGRLAALEASLSTEDAKLAVRELDQDLSRGKAALEMLVREFAAGTWKRSQVADPRSTRNSVPKAVGVDASGVSVDLDGRTDVIPWSAFGGRPDKLSFLFNERLSRTYTTEEARGIESLVRTAAVLAAVDAASEMFDPTAGARFDEGETKELQKGFDSCRPWAAAAGTLPRYEREARAAALLAQCLGDSSRNAWSSSVAGLERLLSGYGDTLLVRMLSNGRPIPGR